MAACQLTINAPKRETLPSTIGNRRKFIAPTSGTPVWYRIRSTAELYLERIDADDDTAKGTDYETIAAATERIVAIRRGEFCLSSGSASAVVEVTAMSRLEG